MAVIIIVIILVNIEILIIWLFIDFWKLKKKERFPFTRGFSFNIPFNFPFNFLNSPFFLKQEN